MKRTVKLNEVVKALNHAEKFHTSVEAVEWKDDETQTGLIVVSTETSVRILLQRGFHICKR